MKTNLSEYDDFKKVICNDELVYMFGTGISSALTGKPYGWWKWIVDGIDQLKDKILAKALRAELDADDTTENLISVVGKLIVSAKEQDTYNLWMQNSFEKNAITNKALTSTLKKLLLAQDTFVTTNYDLLLEKATGLRTLSYDEPDKAFDMLDKRLSTHVLHIHGVYDSAHGKDNVIADETQYKAIIKNQGAQFIQGILGTRTLIFVGCGKTAEDANISRFIRFANEHLKMNRTYYYLINSNSPVDGLPANIVQIPYGDSYDDIPLFLEDIAQLRLREKIKKSPLVGRTAYDTHSHATDALLRFHYSEQCIPFCGRIEEIKELLSFVNTDKKFSWWSVTGQAGIGKSRLALELLGHLVSGWFGFFLSDGVTQKNIEDFRPFCNMVIVIDYVAERERKIAELMRALMTCFAKTDYRLRFLLIERENSRKTGSWYSKLLQRLDRDKGLEVKASEHKNSFLDLGDLDDSGVEDFISAVCLSRGLAQDRERDVALRKRYESKYERLRYRPLFVQLFVEAWIDNGFTFLQYDDYVYILNYVLEREQARWLDAVGGDQKVCNAFIRLLVRANITGQLDINKLPDYYQRDWEVVKNYIEEHTFSGMQRQEWQASLLNMLCHNIDQNNTLIAPLFPDLIKEYMFCYYTEREHLPEMMREIWQNAPSHFSIFIKRCLMDFPVQAFFKDALNAYDKSAFDYKILVGRYELLQGGLIQSGEDPQVYLDIIDNEYSFWSSIAIPAELTPKTDMLAAIKVKGLYLVAKNYGAWSLFDISDMVSVLDEMIEVKGGAGTEIIKKDLLSQSITELSQASFFDAATYLQTKLDGMVADARHDDFDNLTSMDGYIKKIMSGLIQCNTKAASEYFHEMVTKCKYDYLPSVQVLAHACMDIDMVPFQYGIKTKLSGHGLNVVRDLEKRYPDDWVIRARRIVCQLVSLQVRFFIRHEKKDTLIEELNNLETDLATMKFTGETTDEALEGAWGFVKTFRLNFADEHTISGMIADARRILDDYPHYTTVANFLLQAVRALHKQFLRTPVTHNEVEELFRFVEINPDSESLRTDFFELLEESEDANQREDYLTSSVMFHARQDAKYKPVFTSGVPEADLENEILTDLFDSSQPYVRPHRKIGANELCPCGSGKKFKKCCRGKGIFD